MQRVTDHHAAVLGIVIGELAIQSLNPLVEGLFGGIHGLQVAIINVVWSVKRHDDLCLLETINDSIPSIEYRVASTEASDYF